MKHKIKISDISIGILFTLLFISIGLILVLNFRNLYYNDIDTLDIVETSGIDRETIIENYDALIDYCSPFYQGDLHFPSLAASESGLSHFAETKVIFVSFYYIGAISLVAAIAIILIKRKRKDYSYLLTSSITVIVLPVIVGLSIALNFDKAFIVFHKIFFRNDDWLFNPDTDPIITLLPQEFFMHCAIGIILVVFVGSAVLYVAHRLTKKRSKGLNFRTR
ncbi:MAG TPA: TIGR01906 family membrane protein [Lachnospiraceae bacterium]|nr:TIGR01906 family membrane protein [Lachnospiraceae bacterium]